MKTKCLWWRRLLRPISQHRMNWKGYFAIAFAQVLLLFTALSAGGAEQKKDDLSYVKKETWRETLVSQFGIGPSGVVARALKDFPDQRMQLEIIADWIAQDKLDGKDHLRAEVIRRVLDELGPNGANLRNRFEELDRTGAPAADPRRVELYLTACERRREARLKPRREKLKRIIFTKHFDMGGSHYAYTEGQSDAQHERHFKPGASLCLLELDGLYGKVRTLLDDPNGVIRDPDCSYDGKRILFAWKKSLNKDDYHLYEMNLADGKVRQLTFGLGFADYEGAYLPNGDIIFNSSRCVQIVDCWWTEVSNLFTCDGDGSYLRRLSFDQVHTNYPTVTPDGRVIYTRWDYNDRGQIYPQGLLQMNIDGTGQTELYGNNSWFPTSILHPRGIPGSNKVVAIFSGHHTRQQGWLGIIDPSKGRQENSGAQLIAPVRDTKAVRIDRYGQSGDQFQYPYPLSESELVVTFKPAGAKRFAIYFMTIDGERELLASDPKVSCNQPVPLAPRPKPHLRSTLADYRKKDATIYVQDIYAGPGLKGIPRGAIENLRVVALEFRAAGIGSNNNSGPAGGALISTPISIQGTWDIKKVLGTAKVYDDGSACFVAPPRTPIYFQPLDAKGYAVQTMRSWVTLQPGESRSCIGCHENKNASPVNTPTQAMKAGPQELKPWYGKPRGFSFEREIQPILDKHCVRCHYLDTPPKYAARDRGFDPQKMRMIFTPQSSWRYTLRRPDDHWFRTSFDDSTWPYGPGGFGRRGTPGARIGTEWHAKEIWLRGTFELTEETKPIAPAFYAHHDEDVEIYLNGVLAGSASGYTVRYELMRINPNGKAALKVGKNVIAVYCKQTTGGQFIDVAIVETNPKTSEKRQKEDENAAFSLKGKKTLDPRSLRKWSDSYKALANRRIANWINVQSAPNMLPPYHAGAAKSKLIAMLEEGHYDVELAPKDVDRIATWIDLLVPYCGDYTENMAENHIARYQHFLDKRRRWEEQEAKHIERLIVRNLSSR